MMIQLHDFHINVAQLLREPIGASRAYALEIAPDLLPDGLIRQGPLMGDLSLLRTDRAVLVKGNLRGYVVTQCSRCLVDVVLPVQAILEEEFQPTVDVVRGSFIPVDEEDAALLINEHHVLDLSEVIRQAVLLETPLAALCKPDCAGLCPICGIDWNEATCQCEQEDIDPRWQQLSELLAGIDTI